jgi:hypothetical protein
VPQRLEVRVAAVASAGISRQHSDYSYLLPS